MSLRSQPAARRGRFSFFRLAAIHRERAAVRQQQQPAFADRQSAHHRIFLANTMPFNLNLALRRARRTGFVICLLAIGLAGLFMLGLWRQSYWALAIPVALGVLTTLGLAFSIGATIITVRGIPAEAEHYSNRGARFIAALICAGSMALGVAFLAALWQRSYWALGVPVGMGVLGLLWMIFLIGWAIVSQRSTLPAQAQDEDENATP